jgi:hypothetical protein
MSLFGLPIPRYQNAEPAGTPLPAQEKTGYA